MTTVKFQNMSDCLFSGAHNRTTLLWPEFAIFLFYPRFLLYPPNPHDHYSCLGFVTPILFSSFRTNFAASVHTFPPLLPRQNHFQSRCRGVQSLFARSFRHSPDRPLTDLQRWPQSPASSCAPAPPGGPLRPPCGSR